MGRLAIKSKLRRDVSQRAAVGRPVLTSGMPGQSDVAIAERSRPDHIDLPRAALLGRRPIEPDGPRYLVGEEVILHGDGREGRSNPKQVVSATVAWSAHHSRLSFRDGFLGEARERIVLVQDRD